VGRSEFHCVLVDCGLALISVVVVVDCCCIYVSIRLMKEKDINPPVRV